MKKLKSLSKKTKIIITILVCILVIFTLSWKHISPSTELNTNFEDCSFLLFEEEGVKEEFVMFRDSQTGKLVHALLVTNDTEEDFSMDYMECILNGQYNVNCETAYSTVKPMSNRLFNLSQINRAISALNIEQLDTVEFKCIRYNYEVEDPEQMKEEKSYSIKIPKNLNPGILCIPFAGAKADKQILLENDNVKVTLYGLGHYLKESEYSQEFIGKVLFENKSNEAIPVGVLAAKINGMEFNISGVGHNLGAGLSRIVGFTVRESDSMKLKNIYSVSLLVLTDNKELTGTVNLEGGSWYDVELSSAADPEDIEANGELILDGPDLQVYDQGQTGMRWKYQEGKGQYFWNILVVNDSDQDVEIKLLDIKVDGKDVKSFSDDYVGITGGKEVGAHSKRFMQIKRDFINLEDRPVLSFTIQFRSRGGGSIVYTHEKEIVFEPELHGKDISLDE